MPPAPTGPSGLLAFLVRYKALTAGDQLDSWPNGTWELTPTETFPHCVTWGKCLISL